LPTRITSPDDPSLDVLSSRLAALASSLDAVDAWPAEQLRLCGEAGVFEWFVSRELGGQGWNEVDLLRGYVKLAAACLTTTFVITQRVGAMQRIAAGSSNVARAELLPDLIAGRTFATVGISHLTTSRQHLARPVLRAEVRHDEFLIDGYSPWVTGGKQGLGARTGGSQTSALAIGLASAAIDFLRQQSAVRIDLTEPAEALIAERDTLMRAMLQLADGGEAEHSPTCAVSTAELRARANSLALRASQAALAAAKGAGYVLGHPAGRWCREALFFLVWSCPAPVLQANLCELAGIAE
jgi:alkylation response protein AidB-like acyl-CoA dehydrogenase